MTLTDGEVVGIGLTKLFKIIPLQEVLIRKSHCELWKLLILALGIVVL